MNILICILCCMVSALVTWVLTHFLLSGKLNAQLNSKNEALVKAQSDLQASEAIREQLSASHDKTVAEINSAHEKAIKELKENQDALLKTAKAELALENEKQLKEREESLKKQAEETMKAITGGLDKDIKDMKDAFDAQKKAHAEESSAIKTKFEETVKNLKNQTDSIGSKADDLAAALKGKNKMQGIFGETILENILQAEGLRKGHDYDTEFYLRDKKGNIIQNEETGRKMRPDFVLHFPDETDILLDSKMSLTALADYFAAEDDDARRDASRRNLQSVIDHIKELTDKEYQKFVTGRKTLDYVIMFIPNYGAYQLAKQEDPEIFSKAFSQNVLITTDETLMPFLRLIRSAWVQKEQLENMADIVAGAQKMVDRVALFCTEQAKVEKSLETALNNLKDNGKRLVEGRQSIVGAARDVLDMGVKLSPGKILPESR